MNYLKVSSLLRGAIVVLDFCLLGTAAAQNNSAESNKCRKTLTVDEFLLPEDAAAAKSAFESFRKAVLTENRKDVISHIRFPADFVLNGRGTKFNSPKEFIDQYDSFFPHAVIDSLRNQDPNELTAGWSSVQLSDGTVEFTRGDDGKFRVSNIRPNKLEKTTPEIAEFLDRRLTCPPLVVEGRLLAYNWGTHKAPGFENIYIDHFIVEVMHVVRGELSQNTIRVDFWGVTHLPDYNLPEEAFKSGIVWRMYLRPASDPPSNSEVCNENVHESISSIDSSGREIERQSAIKVLAGSSTPTYAGLPCFEVRKLYFSKSH